MDGRREVLGIAIQPSEAEVFWDEFLRSLANRGLRGVKLIEAFQPRHPKLAELMLRAEDDVLAYKSFPQAHWRQIHSTNPPSRAYRHALSGNT